MWILGVRRLIDNIINKCHKCRRMLQDGMGHQQAPLPATRINISHPFAYTSVDFYGPLMFGIGRGRQQKGYGCIFVCDYSRAVHLEFCENFTTNSFIEALIRFKNRKYHPLQIRCDNAGNFKSATKEVKEWMKEWQDSGEVEVAAKLVNVEFKFIPPRSSHRGGSHEALIRPA